MSRANIDAAVASLDALSRTRALSNAESRTLEVMLRQQRSHRHPPLRRKATAGAKPAGTPNSDTSAAVTAGVSVTARSELCAPGATSHGTGA